MAGLFDAVSALIDKFIPIIRDAFFVAIEDVTDNAILTDVIKAINDGDAEQAFRAIGFNEQAMRPITAAIEQAFEQGGITTAATMPVLNTPTGRAVFRFDVRNSRAEAWLRDDSSKLVTRLTEDARVAVRNVVSEGVQAGRNPRNIALDLVGRMSDTGQREGGIVGLSQPYERAVARARVELNEINTIIKDNFGQIPTAKLVEKIQSSTYFNRERRFKTSDRAILSAARSGKPLSDATVDKLTSRYSDSLLKLRGETIARTEAIASLNRSEWEAVKQAVATGGIDESATQRIWDTAGDARVRHAHNMMEGQSVGVDEPFVVPGSGHLLMYPGDVSIDATGEDVISCRCRVRLKISFISGDY